MDMGIIRNLKLFYRCALVDFTLKAIEESLLTAASTAKEISSKISLLQAIEFISISWLKVKTSTITNCYKHCGFKHEYQNEDHGNPIEINSYENSISTVNNSQEFLTIDANLKCFDENGDGLEEQIINDIVHKRFADEDGENLEEPHFITDAEAKSHIEELRRYFMKEGHELSPREALDKCYTYVVNYKEKST